MDSGSTKKYLLYAIGEILLVVFGILIALQINNWNQLQKDKEQEKEYLIRLQSDLEKDTASISIQLRIVQSKAKILKHLLHGEIDSVNYETWEINNIGVSRYRDPPLLNRNTIDDLLSTGNLRLLSNIELKEQIFDYYSTAKSRLASVQVKYSDWPMVISELMPGDMGYRWTEDSMVTPPTQEDILKMKNNLRTNLSRIEATINAELSYTAIQNVAHLRILEACQNC